MNFFKDKNFKNLALIGVATFILNFTVIFDFRGHFSLPDFISVPYYYNILQTRSGLGIVDAYIFNFFVDIGFDFVLIHKIFYSLFFSLGCVLSFYYLGKISDLIYETKKIYNKDSLEVFGQVMLCILYCYNPWTFERLLMGQYNVLRGHLLFLPIIYYFLEYLFGKLKTGKSELIFLSFLILSIGLISVHHLGFILVLLSVSLVLKLSLPNFKTISYQQVFKGIKKLILPIISVFAGIFVQLFKYTSTYEFDTIGNSSISSLIKAFSPFQSKNIFEGIVGIISGKYTWMTQTLISLTTKIESQYGSISFLIWYNSGIFQILVIGFVLGISFIFIKDSVGYKKLKISLSLLTLLVLILNFGYSYNFQIVNQIFYLVPFSFVYRESGKFYSLFIGLMIVFSLGGLISLKQRKFDFQYLILGFIMISSIVPFLFFSTSLGYFSYPKKLSNIDCRGKLSLVMPFELYTINTYSGQLAVPNHIPNLLDCDFYYPKYLSISSNKSILIEDQFSKSLNTLVDRISKDGLKEDISRLIDLLNSKNITLLIIDSKVNTEYQSFYKVLSEYFRNNRVNISLINISDDQETTQQNSIL